MNEQLLFDRLRYMDRLTGAGISEVHARAHADAMDEALRESVATKIDITAVRQDIAAVEHKIDLAVRDLTIKVGGLLLVMFTALVGIKYFG